MSLLVGHGSKFLELPTELRVMIYECLLECAHPIKLRHSGVLQIDERDQMTTEILRTCKQVNREGYEVLYGDNVFIFWNHHNQVSGSDLNHTGFLSHNISLWIKEFVVTIPALSGSVWIKQGHLDYCTTVPLGGHIVELNAFHTDIFCLSPFHPSFQNTGSSSALRKLTLIFEPGSYFVDWYQRSETDNWNLDSHHIWSNYFTRSPSIWQELGAFLKHRPDVEVVVVWLYH